MNCFYNYDYKFGIINGNQFKNDLIEEVEFIYEFDKSVDCVFNIETNNIGINMNPKESNDFVNFECEPKNMPTFINQFVGLFCYPQLIGLDFSDVKGCLLNMNKK